ncbi:MAG TPA: OmpA family protein [Vicinamibacterales bacterium]|nr:OmpA family protein [Vicinamibacterales bacterium]
MPKNAYIVSFVLAVSLLPAAAAAQQQDAKGCKDHPLFTRMQGYWIRGCVEKQYDERAFEVGEGKKETIGGRSWTARYLPQSNLQAKASDLQILRNFENAVKALGGSVLASPKSRRTMKVAKDGKEFWIDLVADWTGSYGLTIIEREEMAQDVAANAEVFSNDLKNTGRAAVYGIYFDTGKSEVKPESAGAIEEIAKMLKTDPALEIYVVGHTDNVGVLESNMRLSQARAEAVVQALVGTHAIPASRLKAFGSGPYSPVASNDAEEGRAKNRRVELVKQ